MYCSNCGGHVAQHASGGAEQAYAGASAATPAPANKSFSLGKLIIAAIVVLAVIGVIGMFAGGGLGAHDERFVGTWSGTYQMEHNDGLTYNDTIVLKVDKDGDWSLSWNTSGRWLGTDYGTTSDSGTWSSSGDSLSCKSSTQDYTYKYTLSGNGSSLTSADGITLTKSSGTSVS